MSDRIPLPGEGQRLRVNIDAIDDEGRGRATRTTPQGDHEVAVRGAFPGDHVRCVVERKVRSQNLVVARVTDLYESGPAREERVCPHRAPCPGCPLHGLERSVQLDIKRQRVLDAVAPCGDHVTVADVIAKETGYDTRQRVKLVAAGRAGDLRLGLYAPRSHALLDSDRCAYVRRSIDTAGQALKERLNAAEVPPFDDDNPNGLRAVLLRAGYRDETGADAGEEGAAAILLTGAPLSDAVWAQLVTLVDDGTLLSLAERVQDPKASENSLVSGDVIRRSGPDVIHPLDDGPAVDPDAFCQTDPDLAAQMYEMAARFLLGESIASATRPPLSTFEAANDDDAAPSLGEEPAPLPNPPAPVGPVDPPLAAVRSLPSRRAKTARPLALPESALVDAHVPGHFLDAYAGTGGFSQALLWLGAQDVAAIEVAGASASALEHLDVRAHLGRVEEKMEEALRGLPPEAQFTGVVADPPRKGLRGDVEALANLGAPRFCLVSCDPGALKKDAAALCARGYRLVHVVPIDLFPGTPEIEAVAFFERD